MQLYLKMVWLIISAYVYHAGLSTSQPSVAAGLGPAAFKWPRPYSLPMLEDTG